MRPLAIALLGDDAGPLLPLARALRARGHRPAVLTSHRAPTRRSVEDGIPVVRVARAPERPLHRRGFTGPLTQVPLLLRELRAGGYEVAHTFSAPDALAARLWRRRTGGAVLFTCTETVDRATLADRRLRLALLASAVERSDRVLTPDDAARRALERWFAVGAEVVDPADALAHEALYALPPQ